MRETHLISVPRIEKPDVSQMNDDAYTGEKDSFLDFLPIQENEKWKNRESVCEQEVCHGQQGLDNAKPGGISAHTRCRAYWTDSMGKADLNCMH